MVILSTVREVISALGGIRAVAGLTGVEPVTVSAWQTRLGCFPAKTYVILTAALHAKGASASPSLWNMVEAAE